MTTLRARVASRGGRVAFRLARRADSLELLRLIRAYYRFDGIRFRTRALAAALTQLLRSQGLGRIWIMRDGTRAVGYVVLTFNYDLEFGGIEGIVTDLFVRGAYRRRGLGRQALALVDDFCRRAGIHTIELQVEERNTAAQRFYRTLGFRKLSRIVLSREVKDVAR